MASDIANAVPFRAALLQIASTVPRSPSVAARLRQVPAYARPQEEALVGFSAGPCP